MCEAPAFSYCPEDDCSNTQPCFLHDGQRELLPKAQDFSALIEEKRSAYFPGTRLWLFEAIRTWLKTKNNLFWLVGGGGTGKSVVSARLIRDVPGVSVAAYHFCRHDNPSGSGVNVILQSWALMLCNYFPEFKLTAQDITSALNCSKIEDTFLQLINEPLKKVSRKTPVLIILDALDELPKKALYPILNLISGVFFQLPPFIRLFVTSRDEGPIRECLQRFENMKLAVDDRQNRLDLRNYLYTIAQECVNSESSPDLIQKHIPAETRGRLQTYLHLISESRERFNKAEQDEETSHCGLIQSFGQNDELHQAESRVEQLWEDAMQARIALVKFFSGLSLDKTDVDEMKLPPNAASAWYPATVHVSGLKSRDEAKVEVESLYQSDWGAILDFFTLSLVSSFPLELAEFGRRICEETALFQVLRVDNKFTVPSLLGERSILFTVKVVLPGSRTHVCRICFSSRATYDARNTLRKSFQKIASLSDNCEKSSDCRLWRFLNGSALDLAVDDLEQRTNGLFLYATLCARQLRSKERRVDISELSELPTGIHGFYNINFARIMANVTWTNCSKILALIVAAREFLPVALAAEILTEEMKTSEFQDTTTALGLMFPIKDDKFVVMHKSVVDWLCLDHQYGISQASLHQAHLALAQVTFAWCISKLDPSNPVSLFSVRHVLAHLCESKEWEKGFQIIFCFPWMCAFTAFEPFALIQSVEVFLKAIDSEHPMRLALFLIASALRLSFSAIIKDPLTLAAQLIGRLVVYEKENPNIGAFLAEVPGTRAACGMGGDNTIWIWTLADGEMEALYGHSRQVTCVDWHQNGRFICSGSEDSSFRIWDAEKAECVTKQTTRTELTAIHWTVDEGKSTIYTGHVDGKIDVWTVHPESHHTAILTSLHRHREAIKGLISTRDGLELASASKDRTLRFWNVKTNQPAGCTTPHGTRTVFDIEDHVNGICLSPDDDLVCVAGSLGVTIMGRHDWGFYCRLSGMKKVTSVSWAGDYICAGCEDRSIHIWSFSTRTRAHVLFGHSHEVTAVKWVNTDMFCSASRDGSTRLWNLKRATVNHQSAEPMFDDRCKLTCLTWTKYGNLASACSDGSFRLFNIEDGTCQVIKDTSSYSTTLAASVNGCVAMGGEDCWLRIYDEAEAKIVLSIYHPDTVPLVTWNPDGSLLASVSKSDRVVFVWSYPGRHLLFKWANNRSIQSIVWLDAKRICTGGIDSTVRVWVIPTEPSFDRNTDAYQKRGTSNFDPLVNEQPFEACHFTGHERKVTTLSSLGNKICSGSFDATVKIWEPGAAEHTSSFYLNTAAKRNQIAIHLVHWMPNNQIICADENMQITVIDMDSRTIAHSFKMAEPFMVADIRMQTVIPITDLRALVWQNNTMGIALGSSFSYLPSKTRAPEERRRCCSQKRKGERALLEARADGMERLTKSCPPDSVVDVMKIQNAIPQKIAEEYAKGLQGLHPQIWSMSGEDAGGMVARMMNSLTPVLDLGQKLKEKVIKT